MNHLRLRKNLTSHQCNIRNYSLPFEIQVYAEFLDQHVIIENSLIINTVVLQLDTYRGDILDQNRFEPSDVSSN